MDQSNSDLTMLADELRLAAHRLQRYERAQAEAAALAAPLAHSLRRLAEAADAGLLPENRRFDSIDPMKLLRRIKRRGLAFMYEAKMLDARAPLAAPFDDDDDLAIPELPSRKAARVSEENLMWAREEMFAARDAALETAKLMPLDALSLRVQRLAAIAQDEGARSADLAPLSNAWLGAPVLQSQLARETGKKIRIEVIAEIIHVERRLIAPLGRCLERLIAMAITHSLEDAAGRAAAGKPEEGVVTLIAACDNDGLSITLADDGVGALSENMEEIHTLAIALGGGVQTLTMPNWGSSVTLAIPAPALGPWRLHVAPAAAPGAEQGPPQKELMRADA